jgi:hypothetical protein
MRFKRTATLALTAWLSFILTAAGQTGGKKTAGVWTDASHPSLPADFAFQGEYGGGAGKIGCQVISLGHGEFQAVVLTGGLPGAGWDGKNKSILAGKLDGTKVVLTTATGKRKYLAQSPEAFSATLKFPPPGQEHYPDMTGSIADNKLTLQLGKSEIIPRSGLLLKKTERKSPTLGKAPPAGAIVLFDGTSTSQWNGGRLDNTTGFLNTDGSDITTKQKFNNYEAHVEFLLPYRPDARGQGRGNSGFYQVDQYEVQILDSFGLEGMNNECGGVYTRLKPLVNMCLPPLQWQTYDVVFTNAVRDESGKKIKNARITLQHNGVTIHDNAEIAGPTGGARNEPEGTAGILRLQGHGNPLQFRNIWVVERK